MKENLPAMQIFADNVAKEFWNRARRAYGEKIGQLPQVKLNKRLTSTAGRAFLESGYIDLSVYLLGRNTDYYRRDTIPHELCHMIAWRLYQDRGHGQGWKSVMAKMGVDGGRCHSMQTKRQAEGG